MFISKIFIGVLVLYYVENSYGKECDDCYSLQLCPGALELVTGQVDEDSRKKLRESFCGYEYLKQKTFVKVCCSDFTVPAENSKTISTKDAIETHPNVKLLPTMCGYIDSDRNIGSNVAKLYEFPWLALISFIINGRQDYKCTGTIVNSKYILTAGHCVRNSYHIVGIRVGDFNIINGTDCQGTVCESHTQDIEVENIILHPNFTLSSDVQNDIGLIRLKKPIDFSYKNALPICLPISQKHRNVSLAGKTATVAGWYLNDVDSNVMKGSVSIKTDEVCKSLLTDSKEDRILKEICADEQQRDNCQGDAGSPLMVEDVYEGEDRYIQYGIVSRGSPRCGALPGIYTDVSKFMGWILDNMRE